MRAVLSGSSEKPALEHYRAADEGDDAARQDLMTYLAHPEVAFHLAAYIPSAAPPLQVSA